jgi:hypothetical protein
MKKRMARKETVKKDHQTLLTAAILLDLITLNTVSRRQEPLHDASKQSAGIFMHHSPRQNMRDVSRCLSCSDVVTLLCGINCANVSANTWKYKNMQMSIK